MISGSGPHLEKLVRFTLTPLSAVFAFDMAVAFAYLVLGWHWVALTHIPLTIFGGVIGVIVGFRNNSSYARWWEGRTLWGAIVNYSRTLARQTLTFPIPADPAQAALLRTAQESIIHHQIAYVYALRDALRGQNPGPAFDPLHSPPGLELLRQQRNVPNAILQKIASTVEQCFSQGWIDTIRWSALDSTLTALANAQGGIERIKNTPMPKQYDFFPQAFVTVYCVLLPLALVANLRWLTPLGSTLIGFIFLALDRIGRDLEAPFDNTIHDVPMTAICKTIESNLRQLLGEHILPEAQKPIKGVLW